MVIYGRFLKVMVILLLRFIILFDRMSVCLLGCRCIGLVFGCSRVDLFVVCRLMMMIVLFFGWIFRWLWEMFCCGFLIVIRCGRLVLLVCVDCG